MQVSNMLQGLLQHRLPFILLTGLLALSACDGQATLGPQVGDGFSANVGPPAGVEPVLNPDTGNYYAAVAATGLTWYEAEAAAAALKYRGCTARLLTVNSADENAFIGDTFPEAFGGGYWLGGIQDPGAAEPAGGWGWVTDEDFNAYTNWNTGEPNNAANTQTENVTQFASNGKWNDIRGSNVGIVGGYVVEYDCAAKGTVIEKPVYNPDTGNYYAAVADGGRPWSVAAAAAASTKYRSCRGHLATITSAEENAFIVDAFPEATSGGYWLGGIQEPGSAEPAGGWGWVTDEDFNVYANWNTGEPNNTNGTENVLIFAPDGTWNDIDGIPVSTFFVSGYVVEYDCNDRGTVVEFPSFNPETGNYYAAVSANGITWSEAEAAAASMQYLDCPGHLATITSADENAFIAETFPEAPAGGYWLGGIQDPSAPSPSADWGWVTGEPFGYTNWNGGEPNDADNVEDGAENVLHFAPSAQWNDNGDAANLNFVSGYVVEYACASNE